MIIAVKIRNRVTGEYRPKGYCNIWSKTGKSWARLKDAKLAVCPDHWHCKLEGDFIKNYQKELESDFLIFHDNRENEIIPVAQYYIERLTKEADSGYGSERANRELEEVRKYCKENNIFLKEE